MTGKTKKRASGGEVSHLESMMPQRFNPRSSASKNLPSNMNLSGSLIKTCLSNPAHKNWQKFGRRQGHRRQYWVE
jgi:hypothetical protein